MLRSGGNAAPTTIPSTILNAAPIYQSPSPPPLLPPPPPPPPPPTTPHHHPPTTPHHSPAHPPLPTTRLPLKVISGEEAWREFGLSVSHLSKLPFIVRQGVTHHSPTAVTRLFTRFDVQVENRNFMRQTHDFTITIFILPGDLK